MPRRGGSGPAALAAGGTGIAYALSRGVPLICSAWAPPHHPVPGVPSRVTPPAAIPGRAAGPRAPREAIGGDCDEVVRRAVAPPRRRGATPALVRAPRIVTASRLAAIVPSRAVFAAHAAGRPLAPLSIVAVARGVNRVEIQ